MPEATVDGVPIAKLTKAYIRLREARADAKARFDAEDKALREQQDKVKSTLLQYCKEQGVESVRTSEGVFYRTVRKRYWTNDWPSMHKFILDHQIPEFFEKRLNQGVVADFLEEHPDEVPPGLNVNSEYSLSVRKK